MATNSAPKKVSITLPVAPVAWGRVKRGRFGQAYVPPKTLKFKNEVATWLRSKRATNAPLIGALKLTAKFIVTPPKRNKNVRPLSRPDLDNYLKGVMDACNGILWIDDAQVVEYGDGTGKYYDLTGSGPRIELEVCEVSP